MPGSSYFPDNLIPWLVITACMTAMVPTGAIAGPYCNYSTYTWNTLVGRAVDYRTVRKLRTDLTAEEIHWDTGCTVCEEDMTWVSVPGVEPVLVCAALAPTFQSALDASFNAGEHIGSLVGRRVGKTKGPADEKGNRTQFSFHSYGIALDVNPGSNGLYTDCYQFGPQCRILQGGPWDPFDPGSITTDSVLVNEMKAQGLKWGGEISGRQKDFMHFSPTGY